MISSDSSVEQFHMSDVLQSLVDVRFLMQQNKKINENDIK